MFTQTIGVTMLSGIERLHAFDTAEAAQEAIEEALDGFQARGTAFDNDRPLAWGANDDVSRWYYWVETEML